MWEICRKITLRATFGGSAMGMLLNAAALAAAKRISDRRTDRFGEVGGGKAMCGAGTARRTGCEATAPSMRYSDPSWYSRSIAWLVLRVPAAQQRKHHRSL